MWVWVWVARGARWSWSRSTVIVIVIVSSCHVSCVVYRGSVRVYVRVVIRLWRLNVNVAFRKHQVAKVNGNGT